MPAKTGANSSNQRESNRQSGPSPPTGGRVTQPVTTWGECATTAISTQGARACSDRPHLPACFALLPLPLNAAASLRMGPWETVHPQKQAAHLPVVLLKVSVTGWVLMGTQWGSICKPRHYVQNGLPGRLIVLSA
ncbi:predicted protein [Postia placenta Mad-698-R]|nr:predicted protein [Postia placenta Mad-698-R]